MQNGISYQSAAVPNRRATPGIGCFHPMYRLEVRQMYQVRRSTSLLFSVKHKNDLQYSLCYACDRVGVCWDGRKKTIGLPQSIKVTVTDEFSIQQETRIVFLWDDVARPARH